MERLVLSLTVNPRAFVYFQLETAFVHFAKGERVLLTGPFIQGYRDPLFLILFSHPGKSGHLCKLFSIELRPQVSLKSFKKWRTNKFSNLKVPLPKAAAAFLDWRLLEKK